jgi:hypothetical protein
MPAKPRGARSGIIFFFSIVRFQKKNFGSGAEPKKCHDRAQKAKFFLREDRFFGGSRIKKRDESVRRAHGDAKEIE